MFRIAKEEKKIGVGHQILRTQSSKVIKIRCLWEKTTPKILYVIWISVWFFLHNLVSWCFLRVGV